jgi:subtilisin family serine protease
LLAVLGLLTVAAVLWGVVSVVDRSVSVRQSTLSTESNRSSTSGPTGSSVAPDPIAPDQVKVLPEVQQNIDSGQNAPVILKLAINPTGTDDERIDQVRAARDALLAKLPVGSWSQVKDVGTLPYVALTLDVTGVEATRQSGQVEVVADDDQTLFPLSMTESQSLAIPSSINSTATMGALPAWAAGWKGAGSTVAVIDTGVETSHPYLMRDGSPKTIAEACFAKTSGSRQSTCPNGVSMLTTDAPVVGSAQPCPSTIAGCAHGTHVSGIAVGGDGVSISSGVAPDASLIAINVFSYTSSGPSAATSDINNALQWLYYNRDRFPGLTSVNMSLGDSSQNTSYCDTYNSTKPYIDQLLSAGVATVVAAGNNGWANAVSSPGCISTAVTVGAVDGVPDATTNYSNDGPQVDLMAPGSNITSSVMGGQMGLMSGTSMATPAVAGAFAALRQATPALTLDRLRESGYVVNASGYLIPSVRLNDATSIYPGPVQSVSVATDSGQATVQWQAPVNSGSNAVIRYSVRSVTDGATCTTVTLSCTIFGLSTGSAYSFVVRAESVTGLGASTATSWTTIVSGPTATTSTTTTTTTTTTMPSTTTSPPVTVGPVAPDSYNGVAPARIFDTRASNEGGQTVDGRDVGQGKVGPRATAVVSVAGRAGVPLSGAGAVALNVTVVNPTLAGHVTVYPSGSNRPENVSNLNFLPGATVPNMVIAKLGSGGSVSIFNANGSVDLVIDVVGWFSSAGGYEPLTPARIVETRAGNGFTTTDGRLQGGGAIGTRATLSVPVLGRGGVPGSGVSAVALNVTAVNASAESYLTVFPGRTIAPNASNLNFNAGQTIANSVIAAVGTDGTVSILNNNGLTDVVVDVVGWFGSTSQLTSLNPARLVDSRSLPTIDGLQQNIGPIRTQGTLRVAVAGRGGVPASGVRAVALNVTVVSPTASGHLTAFPSGGAVPGASNLNFVPGQTVPNMVIAQLGSDGKVVLLNSNGSTPVVVDVVGWFS